jgi:hypothetical protein
VAHSERFNGLRAFFGYYLLVDLRSTFDCRMANDAAPDAIDNSVHAVSGISAQEKRINA